MVSRWVRVSGGRITRRVLGTSLSLDHSMEIAVVNDPTNLGAENVPATIFWATMMGFLSLVTGRSVLRNYLKALWDLAVLLPALTVLGSFSVGLSVAPFALLVVASSVLLAIGSRDGRPTI